MQKQKMSHEDITYILNSFFTKREELILPFREGTLNEWIALTITYEWNPSAFNLVRDRFVTLWIDTHFESFLNADLPKATQEKALKLVVSLIDNINPKNHLEQINESIESSSIRHDLLLKKVSIIEKLLNHEDRIAKRLEVLRHLYGMNKQLFEREFKKYENMLENNKPTS